MDRPSRRRCVLVLVSDSASKKILLIAKKRGLGQGRWNFPGGKVEPQESLEAAAIRECQEETGLRVRELKQVGRLVFDFEGDKAHHSNECFVFTTETFEGLLFESTEECDPFWHPLTNIPYEKFWEDDRIWVPRVLRGECVNYEFLFSASDKMISQKVLQ